MKTDLRKFQEKYEKMLSNDPASIAFVFLGQILYKQKNIDKAMNVLIKGLRHNKNNITGRFLLGKIYYECWKIELAKKELENTLKLAPDNLAAGKILIDIYKSEDNSERALEILTTLKSFHQDNEELSREILAFQNDKDMPEHNISISRAVNDETQTGFIPAKDQGPGEIEGTEEDEITTMTMADIYMGQGLYEKASQVLEKIIETDPGNVPAKEKLEKARLLHINKSLGVN